MAGRRRRAATGGGHGGSWVVTFADLVSLLMAFFVMIVSFSVPNTEAVSRISGSMREAFGAQPVPQRAGIIEREGVPVRIAPRAVGFAERTEDVEFETESSDERRLGGPEANTHDFDAAREERPRQFLSAAETLRQALAEMPDFAEISRAVLIDETGEGLHLRIVDQDGRAMFDENSVRPNPTLKRILERLAPSLHQMPNRIRISGHTSAGAGDAGDLGGWRLSLDRAVAAASVLAASGLGPDRLGEVAGLADSQPLYASDPHLSANRRIEILVISEAPPLPPDLL